MANNQGAWSHEAMEYLNDPVGLEMWRGPVVEVEEEEEEEGGDEDEEAEDESDHDFVVTPVQPPVPVYEDRFTAVLDSTVPDPIKLRGVGGVTL